MGYAKIVVSLLVIVILSFVVVGEEVISNETVINSSDVTSVVEEPAAIEILPVEEASAPVETTPPAETAVSDNTVTIQPMEEPVAQPEPIQEAAPVEETIPPTENSSDTVTGSVAIEPVVEQPTILKTILDLIINKLTVLRGEIVQLTAYLSYENKTPLPMKEVAFYAGDEKIGSDITNAQGKVQFLWNTSPFKANIYVISAEYAGEDGVVGSSSGNNVAINELVQEKNDSVLTTAAVADTGPVQKIQDCVDVQYAVEEPVYGTCTWHGMACDDEPANTTCSIQDRQYQCKTIVQSVTKTRQECKTTELRVDNGQKIITLDIRDYVCSSEESGTVITVVCDSKFDGNGDGKCSSGESCQKIVIDGSTLSRSEKNSEDEYTEASESYFVQEAGMEVLQ